MKRGKVLIGQYDHGTHVRFHVVSCMICEKTHKLKMIMCVE